MIAEASPLIATILCEHQVKGTSLMDSASRLATLVDNTGEGSKNAVPLRSCFFALSDDEWASLEEAASQSNNIDALNVLATLDVIRHDMRVLLRRGIAHLSQWKEATQEDKADAHISEITMGALDSAVGARYNERGCFAELKKMHLKSNGGSLFFQVYVVQPIVRLCLHAICSDQVNLAVVTSHAVPGAIQYAQMGLTRQYLLYTAVRSAGGKDALEEAWKTAVKASLVLTPQTTYSTVVMAVAGTNVRIGLLTLEKVGNALQKLPADVVRGFKLGGVQRLKSESRTRGDLNLLHIIEFCALKVKPIVFDETLVAYFRFVMQKIKVGIQQPLSVREDGDTVRSCFSIPKDYLKCSGDIVVWTSEVRDLARFCEIHKKVGHPIHQCGAFVAQYRNEYIAHACCVYDYVEGSTYSHNTTEAFASVCVAVIHLHDKLHVCHGDISRGHVIVNHLTYDATLIGYRCAVDSIDTEPDASISSVKALNKFLASMEPSHREYVEADHWLFHRLADVLAVFQRVLFNGNPAGSAQAGPSSNGAESTGGRVDAKADSDEEDYREVENVILHIFEDRIFASSSPLLPTEQLILAILKKCEQHSTLKRLFAGTGAAVQKRLIIIRERHESVNV